MSNAQTIPRKVVTQERPAPDELVPSRYAVRVGDIDVLVISDGILTPPAESMATNAEPEVRDAWLDDRFLSKVAFDWALNAVVVRSGDQTILIDSGLGEEYPDFPRAGQFVHRMEAAGVDLAAVTDVVLTHMHFDHVGGLLVEGVKERMRPDLRVRCAPPRPSSGRRPISRLPPCHRRSQIWRARRPSIF